MEILIIIVGLYLIGCVLAYGRVVASFYEIEEQFIESIPLSAYTSDKHFFNHIALASWVSFIAGTIIYFIKNEKYFFKWSFKDLK